MMKRITLLLWLLLLLESGCTLFNLNNEENELPPFVEPEACHYSMIVRQDEQSSTGYYVYIQDILEDVFTVELIVNDESIPLLNLGNAEHTVYRGELNVQPGQEIGGVITLDGTAFGFTLTIVHPIMNFTWNNDAEKPLISWSLTASNMYQLLDGYWGSGSDGGHYVCDLDPDARSFTYPSHPYTELNLFNINANTYQERELGVYSYSEVKLLINNGNE